MQLVQHIKDRTNRDPDQMPGAAFRMHRHTLKLSRASTSEQPLGPFSQLCTSSPSLWAKGIIITPTQCVVAVALGVHTITEHHRSSPFCSSSLPLPHSPASPMKPCKLQTALCPVRRQGPLITPTKQIVNMSCVYAPEGKRASKNSCTTSYHTKEILEGVCVCGGD